MVKSHTQRIVDVYSWRTAAEGVHLEAALYLVMLSPHLDSENLYLLIQGIFEIHNFVGP